MSSFKGSYTIPKVLAACRDLKIGQKFLLTVIASLAKPDQPCDCTHAQLAERVAHNRTTVARWLADLEAKGYLERREEPLPIPRAGARWRYQLPLRIWRIFLRAWSMASPRLRRLATSVWDWIQPRLPVQFFLEEVEKARPRRPPDPRSTQHLPPTPVRGSCSAPDHGEQLSLAGLADVDAARPFLRGFTAGLQFLSPGRQAAVLKQVEMA